MKRAIFYRIKNGAPRVYHKKLILFIVNLFAGAFYSPISRIRSRLLQQIGMKIGDGCFFSEALYVHDGRNLSIQGGARIGAFCRIFDFSPITIGRGLLASHGLTLVSGTHNIEDLADQPGPITIGAGVWIGINVTIVGPVTIGKGSVIGAGSVVLHDIPQYVVAAGTPAKVIKNIPRK